ncbi:hypothetical protein AB0996_06045 [Weissella confusa]|uniref:hypothetical protein n=1 Tax=Weissella confusa TaxID=1583 RepID=UPI00222443C3|nr:hypothetical protein [Weissella confusa]UYY90132.1 hypothetical protein OLB07_10350 [Weissella confusa]
MLKRVLLIMLALVSMSCVSTVAHSDNRSEASQSTLYETPDLILDEKVLDTRVRARDIVNGEDMTMVKKTAFPFMITLLCVWALIIYVHALRTKDKK